MSKNARPKIGEPGYEPRNYAVAQSRKATQGALMDYLLVPGDTAKVGALAGEVRKLLAALDG